MRAFMFLILLSGCTHASGPAETDPCIPTTGGDVCGLPAATLFSRYDEFYGKTISAYTYLHYESGGNAVLAPDEFSTQRGDHYSCIHISLDEASISGAFERAEIEPGMYYARVTGLLVDTRVRGVCFGTLDSADIYFIWRLSGSDT